jgi:hypothetical protein
MALAPILQKGPLNTEISLAFIKLGDHAPSTPSRLTIYFRYRTMRAINLFALTLTFTLLIAGTFPAFAQGAGCTTGLNQYETT